MGAGAFLEPASVIFLLVAGCWVNRKVQNAASSDHDDSDWTTYSKHDEESSSRSSIDPANIRLPLSPRSSVAEDPERTRRIKLWNFRMTVVTPDTRAFQNRWFSRVLQKFPFLVEVWYWALIYWVYQLARAFSAVTLSENTVLVAQYHALKVIELEHRLHIFYEIPIQQFFLRHPFLMLWTNRIYSFIHIPGTILFLIVLFWYTTARATTTAHMIPQEQRRYSETATIKPAPVDNTALYQARRRTMALCNLLAFLVFTAWPCMPPRLLSDPNIESRFSEVARSYGFVDTVHGDNGEASVWTQNKFCNQYAAMPSLHFGYSALIGLTIATIPLAGDGDSSSSSSASRRRSSAFASRRFSFRGTTFQLNLPFSPKRLACVILGFAYPFIILVAIIATANHFILDAVAGAMICGIAWSQDRILLNLLPIQDYFLALLRVHFPEAATTSNSYDSENESDYEVEQVYEEGNDERMLEKLRTEYTA